LRREFTEDMYEPTSYMTLESFYKALQRDTGVDDSFFMFDYPVPENEEDYQEAVKLVKYVISISDKDKNELTDEQKSQQSELNELRKVLRENERSQGYKGLS
jgi:hypothetical protein